MRRVVVLLAALLLAAAPLLSALPAHAASDAALQPTCKVVIRPRSMLYCQGDCISIYVESSTPLQPGTYITVKIYDSRGVPFSEVRIPASQLVEVNGRYYAPYWLSVVSPAIPSDAEAGFWSWEAEYYLPDSAKPERSSGLFTVVPRVSERDLLIMLSDALSDLNAKIVRVESGIIYLNTTLEKVSAKVSDLDAALASIKSGVFEVKDGVAALKAKLDAVRMAVAGVDDKIARIETTIGEIASDVEEIRNLVNESLVEAPGKGDVIAGMVGRINALEGRIYTSLSVINATISKLIVDSEGKIIAAIDTTIGTLLAPIEKLNATISDVRDDVVVLRTALGEIHISIADIMEMSKSIEDKIAENRAILTSSLIPKVNELKPAVESMERRVAEMVSAVSTIIYVAVAAAVAAAVLSGVNFFLSRWQAAR